MLVIFSDLDGTLLDHSTYSFDAAIQALERIRAQSIPLIFCTSKTRAETEDWREKLENSHPFIVENGGALCIPEGYFPNEVRLPGRRGPYGVVEIGSPYLELVGVLHEAAKEARCPVRGFYDMSAEEVGVRCNIPVDRARLAKQREYDEPFEILGPGEAGLLAAIEARGKRWTRGGRFHHIVGANDKAHCVNLLIYYFQQAAGSIKTAGLGDGLNDAGFLRAVDIPVVIDSDASAKLLAQVPAARRAEPAGPQGWNTAVMRILDEYAAAVPAS